MRNYGVLMERCVVERMSESVASGKLQEQARPAAAASRGSLTPELRHAPPDCRMHGRDMATSLPRELPRLELHVPYIFILLPPTYSMRAQHHGGVSRC